MTWMSKAPPLFPTLKDETSMQSLGPWRCQIPEQAACKPSRHSLRLSGRSGLCIWTSATIIPQETTDNTCSPHQAESPHPSKVPPACPPASPSKPQDSALLSVLINPSKVNLADSLHPAASVGLYFSKLVHAQSPDHFRGLTAHGLHLS